MKYLIWISSSFRVLSQVSISAEHQDFFIFLQRLVSPVLEAYSGAAIFIHSLVQPTSESDYTQKLFRYLLTRTEKGLAVYGKFNKNFTPKIRLDAESFDYNAELHFQKSVFWHKYTNLQDAWKIKHFIFNGFTLSSRWKRNSLSG